MQGDNDILFISIDADSSLQIEYLPFEGIVDVDDLLTIHYHNLYGEILTISVLVNRVGILRAKVEEMVRLKKMELEVQQASLYNMYQRQISADYTARGASRPPSSETISNAVILDVGMQVLKKNLIQAEKDYAIIDSLYWSVKDKSAKLAKLSERLVPSEFESSLVEETVNSVYIRKRKNIC